MSHSKATPAKTRPRVGGVLNPSMEQGARGMIVEGFAKLEALIELVIAHHYLGTPTIEFYNDVLHDELFSFALRRNIFEKILRARGLYDDAQMQQIRKMSKIRNSIAHARTPLLSNAKPDSIEDLAYEFLAIRGAFEKYLERKVIPGLGISITSDHNLPLSQSDRRTKNDIDEAGDA